MATPFRHFNTFFGDPVRAILTMHLNKAIKEDNLVELAVETGAFLETRLNELAKKYPRFIQNVRGKGTFLASDSETVADREALINGLRKHGIIQGICGTQTIRLRPSLYFEKKHADIYTERLD